MKKILQSVFIGVGLFTTGSATAQMAAYTNLQRQFISFDDGVTRQIDYLIPQNFAVGRKAIAYTDNASNFKIYSPFAGVQKLNSAPSYNYKVTDNLVTYTIASNLFVWEKGEKTLLSKNSDRFATGDSVVLYFDKVRNLYNAYYNGQIYEIESFLAGNTTEILFAEEPATEFSSADYHAKIANSQLATSKVGDNIIAYVNFANQFKMFYRGSITQLEDYKVRDFEVGRNTIAYVTESQQFKIFHSGKLNLMDNIAPESYKVGDDLVAYVGSDYNFRIFFNDSTYVIGNYDVEYYVKDNIVVFNDANNYMNVFYKGKIYQLETYFDNNFVISYNSLAYYNRARVLRMFTEGKVYDVTSAEVSEWTMQYDVLNYKFGANMYKVFYKGETF